jgi:hypothetical protein
MFIINVCFFLAVLEEFWGEIDEMKADQERLVAVLKDTISLLCKNSLAYNQQVIVQGLICVTVDKEDVVVVQVNDQLGDAASEPCSACGLSKKSETSTPRERKKRRRHSAEDSEEEGASTSKVACTASSQSRTARTHEEQHYDDTKVKAERDDSEEDEDLIMISSDIKGENHSQQSYSDNDTSFTNNSTADNSFITGFVDGSNISALVSSQGGSNQWTLGQAADQADLSNSQAGPSVGCTPLCLPGLLIF